MDNGDKSWINLEKRSEGCKRGVKNFLDKAFATSAIGEEICCPCKNCANCYWYYRSIVENHLESIGLNPKHSKWVIHGEESSSKMDLDGSDYSDDNDDQDNINGLLHDRFRYVIDDYEMSEEGHEKGPTTEVKKFYKLVEEGQEELYLGCRKFSKLSFTI